MHLYVEFNHQISVAHSQLTPSHQVFSRYHLAASIHSPGLSLAVGGFLIETHPLVGEFQVIVWLVRLVTKILVLPVCCL